MRSKRSWLLPLFSLLIGAPAVAYEEPAYRVVEEFAEFEIREYAPQLVAETTVEGDFDDAGSQAFRILFAYISGENRSSSEIAMTAPVTQQAEPEGTEIAMTAPVVQQESEQGRYVYHFVMPAAFTRETLPEPTDSRVRIRELPSQRVAARRYSGVWSQSRYRKEEAKLLAAVEAAGLEAQGAPVFARYNSPFSLWFLRRNEVLVEVGPAGPE